MDYPTFLRLEIVAVAMSVTLCAVSPFAGADDQEPIAYVGHGAFFDHNGNQIVPTPEFIASALAWYRAKLILQLGPQKRSEFEASERRAREGLNLKGQSQLVLDARMVDWLLANAGKSEDIARIQGKLNAVKHALEWQLPERDDLDVPQYEKKFKPDPQLLERLKTFGFVGDGMQVRLATTSSGADYVTECMANGVPIPPPIGQLDPQGLRGWKSQGLIPKAEQFITNTQAEVMTYHSSSPEGLCIALPRSSETDTRLIILDGVICLGKVSSKVCFWDNQMQRNAFTFRAGTKIPIGSPNLAINPDGQYMAGGAELLDGSGGVCTDCHAGRNPYIIHAQLTPQFDPVNVLGRLNRPPLNLPTFSDARYDPLVAAAWPQNRFSQPQSTVPGVCSPCHRPKLSVNVNLRGGEFPRLSTNLSGYCDSVLTPAVQGKTKPAVKATMPPDNPGSEARNPDVKAFLARCDEAEPAETSDWLPWLLSCGF
jgi:hypothetical protein